MPSTPLQENKKAGWKALSTTGWFQKYAATKNFWYSFFLA